MHQIFCKGFDDTIAWAVGCVMMEARKRSPPSFFSFKKFC